MAREPVQVAGDQAGQFPWRRFLRTVLWGTGALVFTAYIGIEIRKLFVQKGLAGWEYWSLFLGGMFLSVVLERIFYLTGIDHKWHYRLAFLVPAGGVMLLFFTWAMQRVFMPRMLIPLQVVQELSVIQLFSTAGISLLGCYLGALSATFVHEGVWENNYPPPEQVQLAVLNHHEARFLGLYPPSFTKRAFDICLAVFGMIASAPVWLVGVFLVWFEDPGPVLFVKNSVGIGGMNFHQFKLRTMVRGAEEHTGPVLSQHDDRRILISGHFFRKTALDELPQLLNILLGEMSFVGPRPQRTVLVHQYLQSLPDYADRHQVLPGLAGLAQVAGDYYLSAHQKLRFDKLYIRHASLGFDIKLLVLACLVTFWFRWQKGWNGRLPRKLMRIGSRRSYVS